MKYVVSGYIGFNNFGDELIAEILTNSLKQKGAEKITLISSNPELTARIHGVNSCGMLNFFSEIKNADVLVSGGGSLLQDVTSLKSLLYYLFVIYVAIFLQKDVVIYAQGIGPVNSKIGNFLMRNALKRAKQISVRDAESQELLKNWDIESELVQDPALSLNLPHRNCIGTVGVQLRSFKGIDSNFLEKLSDGIVKNFNDKKIKIFALQENIDSDICKQFAKMLKTKGVAEADVFYSPDVNRVIEEISDLEYLIGMRFHSIVVGIKSGVKTLAINYDPKVEKLANEYGVPLIEISGNDIFQKISEFRK